MERKLRIGNPERENNWHTCDLYLEMNCLLMDGERLYLAMTAHTVYAFG